MHSLEADAGGILRATFFLLLACSFLAGCATPSERFAATAAKLGLEQESIDSGLFQQRIFSNARARNAKAPGTLHVYLDGDGTPWLHQHWKAADPTSRNPLILQLLHRDDKPAILLGRPCYHGFSNVPPCQDKYWTSQRYSRKIVTSMTRALKKWLKKHAFDNVVLIGFSGGGVLAVLMAPDLPQVTTVVTVAANLDVAEWSRHHSYTPLEYSLNPAELQLSGEAEQIHIAGAEDRNVPAYIIKTYARQHHGRYLSLPGQDHHCCWLEVWPEILELF